MNNFIIALIITAGFGVVVSVLSHGLKRQQLLKEELLAERERARKRMSRREKRKEQKAVASHDKEFWKNAFYNKDGALKTVRVSQRQYGILLLDSDFLSNKSGAYSNIKGIYRNNKVMIKLPSRKGMKYGHNNQKTK